MLINIPGLPFTGADIVAVVLVATLAVAVGFALRSRRVRAGARRDRVTYALSTTARLDGA
jgi:hypothetical protein